MSHELVVVDGRDGEVECVGWLLSYPHAQFNVFATVHLHAGVQKTDLAKVFPINHKGAADHGWSSEWGERENVFEHDVIDVNDSLTFSWLSTAIVRAGHQRQSSNVRVIVWSLLPVVPVVPVLQGIESNSSTLATHFRQRMELSCCTSFSLSLNKGNRMKPTFTKKNWAAFTGVPSGLLSRLLSISF